MKKTSLLLYLAFPFCGSISFAQQALTPEVLQTLKESYSHDDAHKAIRNAVNANSIKKLTANSEQAATPDTWFSHKVKSSGISDQKSSGRCWLFTGTNVIRAQVMARTGMKNFFSRRPTTSSTTNWKRATFSSRHHRHAQKAHRRQNGGMAVP